MKWDAVHRPLTWFSLTLSLFLCSLSLPCSSDLLIYYCVQRTFDSRLSLYFLHLSIFSAPMQCPPTNTISVHGSTFRTSKSLCCFADYFALQKIKKSWGKTFKRVFQVVFPLTTVWNWAYSLEHKAKRSVFLQSIPESLLYLCVCVVHTYIMQCFGILLNTGWWYF